MSLTISGLILFVLVSIAKSANVDLTLDSGMIETTLVTLTQIGSLLIAWYGRVRRGDVTWYGARLKT